MKLVTALIQPFKLSDVREALTEMGVDGVTVTEVSGHDLRRNSMSVRSMNDGPYGSDDPGRELPRVKIEIAALESRIDDIVDAIRRTANAGREEDGTIFIHKIDQVVRIRTGDIDAAAL